MPSPFTPIADYGFLSDCHTGALVAPDGGIDWLCVPRFDSASVFGSLLDREAGTFRFGPYGINMPTQRVYEAGSNVLMTTWKTPSGWMVVRDALTITPTSGPDAVTPHTRPPADDDAEHVLVRTAECIDGEVEIDLVCEPVFEYGDIPASWTLVDGSAHTADATGPTQTLRLHTDMALGVEAGRVRARRTLRVGDRVFCSLSWAEGLASPDDVDDAVRRVETTVAFWRNWLDRARIPDHRWRDPIQRSALAIKGLTYMPTGATVAALTTSLPETPGGERNWDYRYTWLRDSTFTLRALHWLNLDWEADEFMQYVADLEVNEDGGLQIMYGIDGRRDLTESTLPHLSGYAGASPVRVGNGAFDQRQNDVFGAALDSFLLHTRRSQRTASPTLATHPGPGRVCVGHLARARSRHLGGSRQAPALRVVEADVLGGARSRRQARPPPRGRRPEREVGCDRRRDPRRHREARSQRPRCAASALRDRRVGRLHVAGPDPRLLSRRRRAGPQQRAGDRRRAHRERFRAALPHRRDRRRAVGQGGHVPDLLVLARVSAGHRRRASRGPAI